MARIDGCGISDELPSGFEGESYGLPLGPGESPATGLQTLSSASADPAAEEQARGQAAVLTTPPVMHVATFPLPPERGDFGNGAVDNMGTEDIFIALCEYDEATAATVVYQAEGFPVLTSDDFSMSTLHRSFANHSGCQKFFHVGNRAFCLYVVLGSHNFRGPLVQQVNEVVAQIELATG
jgi:hypothetical protein